MSLPLVTNNGRRIAIRAAAVLVPTMIIQALHDTEHLTQLWQHKVQGMTPAQSHGLLYFLDLEWNHFIFNGLFLIPLLYVSYLVWKHSSVRDLFATRWLGKVGVVYLFVGTGVQFLHFLEHGVRMLQYYSVSGFEVASATCSPAAGGPCPGTLAKGGLFLGANGFNGVLLHFTFNAVVTILPAVILVALRPEIHIVVERAWSFLRGRGRATPALRP